MPLVDKDLLTEEEIKKAEAEEAEAKKAETKSKAKTPAKTPKAAETKLPPKHWIFKSKIKRNGVVYEAGSICDKKVLEEMKELGFVEEK